MTDKPKASPSLGLEITSGELKGALILYQNRKSYLKSLFSAAIDQESSTGLNVKPLYKGSEEKQLTSLLKASVVVTSLSASEVLIRQLTVQLTKERDIDAVLAFQAEPLLPYPVDEAVLDRIVIEKGKENTKLAIASAKIEQISQHLEKWHSLHVEPEVISCVPMALAAFSKVFYKSESAHIHINIGDQETACALVNKGKLLASQSLKNGMVNITGCLIEEHGLQRPDALDLLNSLNLTKDTLSAYPALSKHLAQFRLELTRVIFSLKRLAQAGLASKILVTGEGSVFKGILQLLFDGMEDGLAELEKIKEFSQPEEQLKKYAIPIGMALTAITKAEDQINFRQREFSYPNPWKRTKKPLATYLASCFLLAFALYFFGNSYISLQEDRLRKDYVDLLALSKKPYDEFEIEIRSKDPFAEKPLPGVEIPVTSLSREDLQKRLNILDKEIRATPDMFPLYPNTPSVTDVLAWLSSHPHVVGDDKGAAAATNKPRLQLESFSYKMVKRPEQNKAREKYQVKVEIEFSTPTPRFAREFHDILLAPNEMVDPKGELKWSAERGKYRASFFLKDKTIYPSSR